ncbi:MAG: amidohydrolase family protein [Candidatus Cloacimonetes bacterium]|nr:amidohydrolase family protein [Candidatus Cloacimonadota bacterium]
MKTLFYNAKFYSLDEKNNTYSAILCDNDKIIETYKDNYPNIEAQKINLNNSFVLPGFIDTHTHSFEGGLYQQGVDLENCNSIDDILTLLNQANIISDMIFAWRLDENNLKEKRFPTKQELDKVNSHTPILIRRIDGHSCIINTPAEKMILNNNKLDYALPDNGILSGSLNDIAAHTFHKNLDNNAILNCYKQAQTIALQNGHTTIHTMIGDANQSILHYPLMNEHLNDFIIDFEIYPQSFNLEQALKYKAKRIGGCILADGSFGSFTAGLSQAYQDKPINEKGKLYQTQNFWDTFIEQAHKNNLQIGVHCIGDEAIMQIVTAVNKAQLKETKDLRHQLIHCELVRDDMIPEIKKAQMYVVAQPMFDALWGQEYGFYHKVLGDKRYKKLNRYKTLTDNDIIVTGGSDWYITDLAALKGINAAVNHHNKNERLSIKDAIKLYTVNAAKLSFDENNKGMIRKNFKADFVCLDKDIFSTNSINIIKVKRTIKNAKIVFSTET